MKSLGARGGAGGVYEELGRVREVLVAWMKSLGVRGWDEVLVV